MSADFSGQSHTEQIYRYLFHRDRVPQQKIAAELGLSMPTLLPHLNELRELRLIREEGTFESTGGRKARAFCVDPAARLSIGLELTAHHISLVLIDMKGHVLQSNRIRHRFADSYFYYATLGRLVDRFVEESRADRSLILGLGISLAAVVGGDHRTIRNSQLLGAPADLSKKLAPHLSFPFLLFNDAKSGGYAEWWDLETDRTILYLSLSGNVGGAVIDEYGIYMGEHERSFELGHVTLYPGGKPCYCGRTGCVHPYLHAGLLSDHTGGKMDVFFQRLEDGDPSCERIFREYLRHLSVVVGNLRMMYDCDIVLGGYVGACMGPYLGDLRELVQQRSRFREDGRFITCCRHKYETAAIGAALYFVDRFISSL